MERAHVTGCCVGPRRESTANTKLFSSEMKEKVRGSDARSAWHCMRVTSSPPNPRQAVSVFYVRTDFLEISPYIPGSAAVQSTGTQTIAA